MAKLTICLTHDVDRVYKTFQYLTHDLRNCRLLALRSLLDKSKPYWMFDRIANLEDKYGIRSTFFFLNETLPFNLFKPKEWRLSLGRYSIRELEISSIIRELYNSGWEIGVHGSYNSYKDQELIISEKKELEDVIGTEIYGIRQHYLNLIEPDTWIYQKRAGFKYDSSLGKTSGIGYRDNRIKPFLDKKSEMFIIPLTFMESNLMKAAEQNVEVAIKLACGFLDQTERDGGVVTILFHQRFFNEFEYPGYVRLYEKILEEAVARGADIFTCGRLYHKNKEN